MLQYLLPPACTTSEQSAGRAAEANRLRPTVVCLLSYRDWLKLDAPAHLVHSRAYGHAQGSGSACRDSMLRPEKLARHGRGAAALRAPRDTPAHAPIRQALLNPLGAGHMGAGRHDGLLPLHCAGADLPRPLACTGTHGQAQSAHTIPWSRVIRAASSQRHSAISRTADTSPYTTKSRGMHAMVM